MRFLVICIVCLLLLQIVVSDINVSVKVNVNDEHNAHNKQSHSKIQHNNPVNTEVKHLSNYTPHPFLPHTIDKDDSSSEYEVDSIVDTISDATKFIVDWTLEFARFIKNFNKQYTQKEFQMRYNIWKQNAQVIYDHNSNTNKTYVLGVNEWVDLSDKEFAKRTGLIKLNKQQIKQIANHDKNAIKKQLAAEAEIDSAEIEEEEEDGPEIELDSASDYEVPMFMGIPLKLPKQVDWRTPQTMNPVQDQGSCGSCWTFASAAALESAWAIKHKQLIKVSEQQFLDCTKDAVYLYKSKGYTAVYKSFGCGGSYIGMVESYLLGLSGPNAPHNVNLNKFKQTWRMEYNDVFTPVEGAKPRAVASISDYKYSGVRGNCNEIKNPTPIRMAGAEVIEAKLSHKFLMLAVSKGPVTISVAASEPAFRNYLKGIISVETLCKPTGQLNHAIVIVGYGTENGIDYWIIRNSWSNSWGENGYVRIARGKNLCGIENTGVRPIVA